MTVFDKLYRISEVAVDAANKPLIKRKIDRALDGAADSYEGLAIENSEKVEGLTRRLANGETGVIPALIKARLEAKEITAQAAEAAAIKAELNAEAT